MQIDDLSAFVAVAREGGFSAAARTLQTQKAHLSRVVARLEARLGARLFNRTTRALTLTEAGRELFERAIGILAAVEAAEAAVQASHAEPSGVLKVSCGVEFGVLAVSGWIAEYLRRYPSVRVSCDMTNRLVDIVHEGLDVAIRVGELADSSLSARRLGQVDYAAYASPAYLRTRAPLKRPADLVHHDLVGFASGSAASAGRESEWLNGVAVFRVDIEPRLRVNNNLAACAGTEAGLGVAMLPRLLAEPARAAGRLQLVLPGWSRAPSPVHAVFSSSRYLAPKVRAFVDLARARFSADAAQGTGEG